MLWYLYWFIVAVNYNVRAFEIKIFWYSDWQLAVCQKMVWLQEGELLNIIWVIYLWRMINLRIIQITFDSNVLFFSSVTIFCLRGTYDGKMIKSMDFKEYISILTINKNIIP